MLHGDHVRGSESGSDIFNRAAEDIYKFVIL